MKQNYQIITDNIIRETIESGKRASLLLHACCAPCSSYVLEYLSKFFDITLFYYNPNISPESEYLRRADEAKRLISDMSLDFCVSYVMGEYTPSAFAELAKGRETMSEGGARCFDCYRLRLERTAQQAQKDGYDYFTTTLSISPHKNAEVLNGIGKELSQKYGVKYLFSDFKKKGGYLRSCQLSKQYGLYRQDYCGCIFSKAAAEARKKKETGNEL